MSERTAALDCPRAGKWIGGCRFEARYDQHPGSAGHVEGDTAYTVAVLKAAKISTYVHSVCRTCGRTVERPPPQPAGLEEGEG